MDESGVLDETELWTLLWESGFTSQKSKGCFTSVQQLIQMLQSAGAEEVTFPWFLVLVRILRSIELKKHESEIRRLFLEHDKDGSDELDILELSHIFQKLHLVPRSPQQQLSIAEFIEEADKDGSGHLNVHELGHMIQRIRERMHAFHRQEEARFAEDILQIKKPQVGLLRQAFDLIDIDRSGCVGFREVQRAAQLMKWQVSISKLRELFYDVKTDPNGELTFMEFLTLMSRIDECHHAERKQAEAKLQVHATSEPEGLT